MFYFGHRRCVPSCLSHAWDTWDTWDSGCTRLAPRAGSLNLGLFAPGLLAPLIRGGGSWAGCMGSSVIFASAPFLGWVHDADDALAARMKMNVMDLNGLVVTPPIPIEHLQQFVLHLEQLDGVAAIELWRR